MKDNDFTKEDLITAERGINVLQDEYDGLVLQKKSKEVDLALIKQDLRIGSFKSDIDYNQMCHNQKRIIASLGELQPKLSELKAKIRDRRVVYEEIRGFVSGSEVLNKNVETNIYELRDKYNEFSSDPTRVSSTRIMASKFTEELQTLIAIIEKSKYK